MTAGPTLVLASTSTSRSALLTSAGVPYTVASPGVDEAPVKAALAVKNADAEQVADVLAEMKAMAVSRQKAEPLVLGADQVLQCAGRMYDKPISMAEAGQHLSELRGQTHTLITAAVIAQGGAVVWRHIARANLQMRDFSDQFIETYLGRAGDDILGSVGGYRVEGLGQQLFTHIDGDHSVILGLPMYPLLEFLRTRGVLIT